MCQTICVAKQVVQKKPADSEFAAAAVVFKLLADETRLRIVWALLHGEHSVNDLADHVGVKPTAVSQHLAKLRLARLVRTRRDGNHIFYAAENEHIEALAQQALLHADHIVGGATHHRSKRATA
jgi:DNA-binding transcriptional ArsR family regulator